MVLLTRGGGFVYLFKVVMPPKSSLKAAPRSGPLHSVPNFLLSMQLGSSTRTQLSSIQRRLCMT